MPDQQMTAAELAVLGLIAGVPSTSPPPVDLNVPADEPDNSDLLGAAEPVAQPVETVTETNGAVSWRACSGQDIQSMLKAHGAGFVRTPGFTREDVMTFLASKGI